MGFWKSFFGLDENVKNGIEKNLSDHDTTFVTYDEEKSFENSIYGRLQLYNADVSYITDVLPERGENLEKQIKLLTQLLEQTNDEDDLEVQRVFRELEKQFEKDKRLADGEYTIKQLEAQNENMDRIFEKENSISKTSLEEFVSYISKIQEKVNESDLRGESLLTNVQRQKFNNMSMKAEYRIKTLELMFLLENGEVETNPFKNLSVTKQKIFSKLFFEDAQKAAKQYEYLSYSEELFNNYKVSYFRSIDSIAQRLNRQITDIKMVDDFSIRQLFDSESQSVKSFDFLKDFIRFKSTLNEMTRRKPEYEEMKRNQEETENQKREKERIEKEKIESERLAKKKAIEEENEKFKQYSNEDIRSEIIKIEHDLTAKGSRYVNILDFQKRVAIAKGILPSEQGLQNDKLVYKAANSVEAWEIIQKSNEAGVNYLVFPDCQENSDGGFMIAVSETDKEVLEIDEKKTAFNNTCYDWIEDVNFGKYSAFIIEELKEKLGNTNWYKKYLYAKADKNELYKLCMGYDRYSSKPDGYSKRKNQVYEKLEEIHNELDSYAGNLDELKDVLCYFQIPATRNMIPILEEFKNLGVTPYIEPVPNKNRNENNRDNINIYFERKELDKFSKEFYSKFSNSDVGYIKTAWTTDMTMGKAIKKEIEWPEQKEK